MSTNNHLTTYLAIIAALSVAIGSSYGDESNDADGNLEPTFLPGPGLVLIVRHALAPGTGDPSHFRIGDCTSARVYSSQWCRCKETAVLMNLGPVQELPALNSFFQNWHERDSRIDALRQFLSTLSAGTQNRQLKGT